MNKNTRKLAIAGLCTAVLSATGVGVYLGTAEGNHPSVKTAENKISQKEKKNPFQSSKKTPAPFQKKEVSPTNPFEQEEWVAYDTESLFDDSETGTAQNQQEKTQALTQLSNQVAEAKKKQETNLAMATDTTPAENTVATVANVEPTPEPIINPTPNPTPIPVPEPTPDPTPIPDPTPEPKPDPEPTYEAYLTVPESITIHALSSFDIQDYATATNEKGEDITSQITSTSVDTTQLGNQTIHVEVANHGVVVSMDVPVQVVNDAPTLTGVEDKVLPVTEAFDPLQGVMAEDMEEGDLTSSITVVGDVDTQTPGEYTLEYSVKDRFGEETKKTVTMTVQAEAPTFYGITDLEIPVGTTFDPREGVEVQDNYGNIEYTVTGEVDTAVPGVYTIEYQAMNQYGVETTKTRQITVTESVK
ncbi:TPA: immunoglobulin-like domain-containing protein [Listeria monocytogenes]